MRLWWPMRLALGLVTMALVLVCFASGYPEAGICLALLWLVGRSIR